MERPTAWGVPEVSCASGKIIRRSSVRDVMSWAGRAHYAASKAGVLMLMKTMAFDSNYSNGTTIYSSHGIKRFLKDPLSRERIRVRGSKSAVCGRRA
jgi:hypothetical protein